MSQPDSEELDAELRRYRAELEERGIEGDPTAEDTTEPGTEPPTDRGPMKGDADDEPAS